MRIAFFAVAGLMVACASDPETVDIGQGNYTLTATAQRGFGSSRQEATDAANEFCSRRHQAAVITDFSDKGPVVLSGYSTSVVFHCQE